VTDALARDPVVLPPVSCDPVFSDDTVSSADRASEPEAAAERRVTKNRRAAARPAMVGDDASRRVTDDPHYFPSLYMRHRWSFALHARRFLSDQRDIDEVVQEGFLRLYLALPELETELQVLAYGRRTITNLCIDRYRADQRRPRLVDLESVPVLDLADNDEVDPVVAAEDAAIIRGALAMLSPLHREALIKREVEEKPLPQIAAELDIPVDQVKHVLYRARRSLRRLLVGTYVEPGVDLDVAMVLAANKQRALAAAKPTGAAALALLLVLAGLLGLRSGGERQVITGLPVGAPPLGHSEGVPGHGPVPVLPSALPVPTRGATVPLAPTSDHRRGTVTVSPEPPAAPLSPTGQVPAPRGTGGTASPGKRPVPHRPPATGGASPATGPGTPPPVAAPVAARSFVVKGVGAFRSAQVSDQQSVLRPQGTASSSTISAATTTGTYALRQAFTFAPDGTLVDVALNESVPVLDGTIGTMSSATSTTADRAADGTTHLVSRGISIAVGEVNGQVVAPRVLTVDLVLDAQRVEVLSETVSVQDATPPPDAAPTPAGAPDPAAGPLTAPPPPVQPAPDVPPGPVAPATRSEAVVVPRTSTR